MTVSTAYSPLSYAGNGSSTAFSVTWPFYTGTLQVTLVDDDGVETVKTISTHYTVSGGTDGNGLPATGTVTMLSAPASGETLVIERATPQTQSSSWTNGGGFQAKTLETSLDKLLLIAQETSARATGLLDGIDGDLMVLNAATATDYWDAKNAVIRNLANGTEDDDAVTKAQMESALSAATIGDTGFVQSGTGAVERTWQSKMREFVSPVDFGAVGDGTTEDGDAVLAAAATGRDVYFPPDLTFLVNGKTIIPSANQRFYGGGRLKKTTTANDLTPAGSIDAPKFFQIHDVDGVTVEGIEFEYAFSGTYSLVTPRLYGVTIQNAERTTIRNNYFAGYETPIFIWRNSRHTQVIGNRSFLGVFGIATGGDGAAGTTNGPVEDTVIAFNTFAGAISEGIDINWDTQRCLIYGNNLYDNSQFQFEEVIDIGGGECFDIWVVNNTIDAAARAIRGVDVKLDTTRVVISGNRIFNGDSASTSGAGVIVDGLTTAPAETTNVTIKDNDISGFYIGVNASRSVEDITISGNRISDVTLRGVYVDTTGNARVTIADNDLDGTGSTAEGILVNVTSDFTISGNRVRAFGTRGISLGATASHGIVSSNTVYNNAERGILVSGTPVSVLGNRVYLNGTEGILLNGVDSIVCSDNRIYDNGVVTDPSYGLNIAASSDHCVITGNYVTDSRGTKRQNGINIASTCDDCVFTGNRSHANKTTDINGVTNFTNSVVSPTTGTLAAFVGTALSPPTSDGAALGTTSLQWSDLFLAEGGVINWDNGDVSITQTGNVLSFAGASTRYEFDATIAPTTSDGAALGTTALMFSDAFFASGAVLNFNNGDVTITHSANALAFAGASGGYTFDAPITLSNGSADGAELVFASNGFSSWSVDNSSGNLRFFLGGVVYGQLTTSGLQVASGVAIPAGGTANLGIRLSSTASFGIFFGSGVPTLSAAQGSLYIRSDGSSTSTRLYVNTNGSTTWTNVTTAA